MSGSSWTVKLRRLSQVLVGKQNSGSDQKEIVEQLPSPNPNIVVPENQKVLLLHSAGQAYQIEDAFEVPQPQGPDEILVKTAVIGLNPIDWKSPDFNFGIPELPYISGREFSGEVVQIPANQTRLKIGDRIVSISTDYRDLRKAAYQEYAVASTHNLVRLPSAVSLEDGATLGVAFVAAALALGVSLGVDFSQVLGGPDLYKLLRDIDPETIPQDVREESLSSIEGHERAQAGDWLAIWGGSATSANLTIQLARLAGLKIVAVVDKAKHGLRLANHAIIRPDLLVDSHDPERAIDIIKANTGGRLRFGIDTRGRDTATRLLQALSPGAPLSASAQGAPPSPPATPEDSNRLRAHLIGLSGLPKGSSPEATLFHTVPVKLYHEVPAVGEALSLWLERLLAEGLVKAPEIIDIEEGLENVNKGLDRMRRGEISGGKLIVRV